MRDSVPDPSRTSRVPGGGPDTVRLTVDLRTDSGIVVVTVVGELDYDSVAVLRVQLQEALARRACRVVLNCHGLWFCDSTGLNLLLNIRTEAQAAGVALVLAGLQPVVARVFEITGAASVFDIRTDVRAAVAG
ncbi:MULTISPECIES: STAS domain-containing protein [Kitasatospora]|jgi:anti-anti-sigma factor|uniref:STAS domain-containing protein n=1 Tax=Kitasatospora TaxID=2063 RepID=UPI000C7027B5|nr:STAS domain-containing protein [Kitasatospora sp. GP30]MDH6143506.1 anti-anti-sigma factor [Kitasatospora sp. GP30]